MKALKRIVSVIMIYILALTLVPVEYAKAEGIQQEGVDTKSDIEETDTPEDTEKEDFSLSDEKEENSIIDDLQNINFAVVEKQTVSIPDTQRLAFCIGDDNNKISDATLFYQNNSTGEIFEVSQSTAIDNTVLFEINFTDQSQNGSYTAIKIQYISTEVYIIDLTDMSAPLSFGVNTEVETLPDAVEADPTEETSSIDQNTVSTDVEGNIISENSIPDAINNAAGSKIMSRTATEGTKSGKNLVVVLDPGHDNKHAGAQNSNLNIAEEKLNLIIAKYCRQELEQYAGVEIYMTRADDGSCPYPGTSSVEDNAKRIEFAAAKKADVYVSIHLNSSTSEKANGAEVYVPNNNWKPAIGQEGNELGKVMLDKLSKLGLNIRGVVVRNSEDGGKYEDGSAADYYAVIKGCKKQGIPAIIVEHAFVTNTGDVSNYLDSDEKLQKLGIADATGIAEYYGLTRESSNNSPVIDGIDYSAVFDLEYYLKENPDIEAAYGRNFQAVLNHFVNFGMKEGRRASLSFDVQYYKAEYSDLRALYKEDLKRYYLHYILYGKAEGRTGSAEEAPKDIPEFGGIDYSPVYNYDYYMKHNPDIVKGVGTDKRTVFMHFINYGMAEGRQANADFNVQVYKGRYFELEAKFGNDLKAYYQYYITTGKAAGDVITEPTTVFNGVDYAPVYSFYTYSKRNKDIRNVYGQNDKSTLAHFVNYGMAEGRDGSENFEVKSYRNGNSDLRKLFKKNWKSYYIHYINYGMKEKRVATGVTQITNPTVVHNGENYSSVYSFQYYCEKNADINQRLGDDDEAALAHFVNYGMSEGRKASATFDVNFYKARYGDLRKAYGDNLKSYYYHYMRYGIYEGREGVGALDSSDLYPIMGTSSVTAQQMVRYFKAKAEYPEFYKNSDAPTLEDFCNIYVTESAAEGVKAEVAFAQAMNETGFLKYGNDVSINQYNFAGLGASGNGNKGLSFQNVREGVRAQIQHLKAYASTEKLNNECVDPRFNLVQRGSAQYLEWLGIKENPNGVGWAATEKYGYMLREKYMNVLLSY